MKKLLISSLTFCFLFACSDETPSHKDKPASLPPEDSKKKKEDPPPPADERMAEFLKICINYENQPEQEPTLRSIAYEAGFRTDDAILDKLYEQNPDYEEIDHYLGNISELMCRQMYNQLIQTNSLYLFRVTDLSLVRYTKRLKTLHVVESQLKTLGPLEQLHELTKLTMEGVKIETHEAIRKMYKLESLQVQHMKVPADFLYLLPEKIKYITIHKAEGLGTTVIPVGRFEHVRISSTDFAGLVTKHKPCNLAILTIRSSTLKDISALSSCKNLFYLDLVANQIEDLEPLENLKGLLSIKVSFNPIENVSPLVGLKKLNSFEAYGIALGNRVKKNIKNCPYGANIPAVMNDFCAR